MIDKGNGCNLVELSSTTGKNVKNREISGMKRKQRIEERVKNGETGGEEQCKHVRDEK